MFSPTNYRITRRFSNPPSAPTSYIRAASNDRFVGFAYGEVVAYSTAQSAPTTQWNNPSIAPHHVEYTTPTIDDVWISLHHAELFSVDEFSGALRWRTPLFPGATINPRTAGTAAFLDYLTRSGDVLVVKVSSFVRSPRDELLGLAWDSGRILWRRPLVDPLWDLVTMDATTTLALSARSLDAIDASTGQVRWTRSIGPFRAARTDVKALAVSSSAIVAYGMRSGITALDPVTGALLRRLNPPRILALDSVSHRAALVGDVLYAAVLQAPARGQTQGVRARAVVATDVRSGRELWRSDEVLIASDDDDPAENSFDIAVDRDSVFTCFQDGTLRVLDRATGRQSYSIGLRGDCEAAVMRPDPATGVRSIVVRLHDSTMALLERGPAPVAAERARITGTIRGTDGRPWASQPVLVDGTLVLTDRAGRFDAQVTQRGSVRVLATGPAQARAMTRVILDGRADAYRVDLQLRTRGPLDL